MFHEIVVLKNLQNSQDGVFYVQYTHACNMINKGSVAGVFLLVLRQFSEQLFCRTPDSFYRMAASVANPIGTGYFWDPQNWCWWPIPAFPEISSDVL